MKDWPLFVFVDPETPIFHEIVNEFAARRFYAFPVRYVMGLPQ